MLAARAGRNNNLISYLVNVVARNSPSDRISVCGSMEFKEFSYAVQHGIQK